MICPSATHVDQSFVFKWMLFSICLLYLWLSVGTLLGGSIQDAKPSWRIWLQETWTSSPYHPWCSWACIHWQVQVLCPEFVSSPFESFEIHLWIIICSLLWFLAVFCMMPFVTLCSIMALFLCLWWQCVFVSMVHVAAGEEFCHAWAARTCQATEVSSLPFLTLYIECQAVENDVLLSIG